MSVNGHKITEFLEALETYVDARIQLTDTDPEPATRATEAIRSQALDNSTFARSALFDAVKELFE